MALNAKNADVKNIIGFRTNGNGNVPNADSEPPYEVEQ